MKFVTVLFYALAALFGIVAISCFADGDFTVGLVGVAVTGLFIYLGIRRGKKAAKSAPPQAAQFNPPQAPVAAPASVAVTRPSAGGGPARWNSKYQYIYEDVEIFTPKEMPVDYKPALIGETVTLQQAPENPHDSRAVVALLNGRPIGYLYRGKFQDMANDFLAAGHAVDAEIEKYAAGEGKIYLQLSFPYRRTPDIITAKLTGNGNESMQDAAATLSVGESVDIEYDMENDKYLVSCGADDIGYLPSSAAGRLSEDEEYEGVVESSELNDAGKYVVAVSIRL